MTVQLRMHLLFWSFSFYRDSTTNVCSYTYTIDTESFIRYISIVWTYIIFFLAYKISTRPSYSSSLWRDQRVSRYIYCTRSHLLTLNGLTRIRVKNVTSSIKIDLELLWREKIVWRVYCHIILDRVIQRYWWIRKNVTELAFLKLNCRTINGDWKKKEERN